MRPHHNRNARGRGGKRSFHGGGGDRRNHHHGGPTTYSRPINSLKEVDVGITEFIGSTTPFNGIIKSKFSDFQVNEIDLAGNVVALTDTTVPSPPLDADTEALMEKTDPGLEGLVTEEEWNRITTMVENKDKSERVQIDVTEMSKESRTKIHVVIKTKFGQQLVSSTVDENGRKFIRCSLFNKSVPTDVRTKWTWPHEYTYFVVHKCNMDTMKACSELALNLNVKPSVLAYAGNKDKRANTSQWFCIRKRDPSKIDKAAARIPNLRVGNFTFKPQTLKLGQLNGNRFKIAIRQISVNTDIAEESLKSVKENGFINYYGLQRFGNSAAIPTFAIGKALLMGKWSDAVELILKPREGDLGYLAIMRDYWWKTRDAKGARNMLRTSDNSIESKLLHGLANHDANDLVNALENIPRNVRLLYLHSYQSLIWNRVASKRAKLGLKPIVGDLVFVDEGKGTEAIEQIDDFIGGEADEREETVEADEMKVLDYKALVKPLTQTDIESGSYTIADIVLPLPGHDVTYPSNDIGEAYVEILAEDGLSSETLKQKNKTYSLTGAYRKMVSMPGNMTWKFVKYNTENDLLLNTDFELIKKDRLIKLAEDGPLTACLLEFSLNSSTYATMALREILKIDTSTENQIKLSQGTTESSAGMEPEEKKVKLDDAVE